MRRIFTVSNFAVFGCIRIIQNGSFCNYRIFALAFSKAGKYIGKKIRMAINSRCNNLCHFRIANNDVDIG